jgi:hypothetical protein
LKFIRGRSGISILGSMGVVVRLDIPVVPLIFKFSKESSKPVAISVAPVSCGNSPVNKVF